MNKTITYLVVLAIIAVISIFVIAPALLGPSTQIAYGATGIPDQARFSTSTLPTVGPAGAVPVFTERVYCMNRVISTRGAAIMVGFTATSSATRGMYQAASTTVSYPASQFGCGYVNVFGILATTTIDATEFLF